MKIINTELWNQKYEKWRDQGRTRKKICIAASRRTSESWLHTYASTRNRIIDFLFSAFDMHYNENQAAFRPRSRITYHATGLVISNQ